MLKDQQLADDFFLASRQEVLNSWPTGVGVNLTEALNFLRQLPPEKVMALCLQRAEENGLTLAQPRAGVALTEEQVDLLLYLQEEGGADLLPTTIDSYTRQNRYQEAQNGIEESVKEGRSMLNGYPAVNHGVEACRRIVEAVKVPVQVRHGTPDARLLSEITLAGGFTDFEGGGISYNIPYAKDVPLAITLQHWSYVDRLVGWYAANGVIINREPFGPLTGTLVPPAISHSVAIIEALLAAVQGVKSITLGYGQGGNLLQDVAAVRTLKELGRDYLNRFGFGDVELTTVLHQWMGGFPQDESRAYGVIGWGAVTASLVGATKVIVKTPHEAVGVPSKEANAAGIKTTKQILTMLRQQTFPETPELATEKEVIKAETRAIVERVLELGDGELTAGVVRAFQAGVIDVPFAPSRFNAHKIMPARDRQGAIRFLQTGNLPFDNNIKEFHQAKLAERGQLERREPSFQMVVDDIYAISKGILVGKPR